MLWEYYFLYSIRILLAPSEFYSRKFGTMVSNFTFVTGAILFILQYDQNKT